MDWSAYIERVQMAERTGDAALVDLVADRALSAVLRDARSDNAAVFVRHRRIDLWRAERTIPLDPEHGPSIPSVEHTILTDEADRDYWQDLAERIARHVKRDAQQTVLSIAQLLADGYSPDDCAAHLGISKMSVSRARATLAAILA